MAKNKRDPKVFLIAPREDHNLKNAEEYGELVTVFLPGHRANLSSLNSEVQYVRRVLQKEAYEPERDFVCLIGVPLLTALFFMAIIADHQCDHMKFLVFVAQEQRYQPRDIYFGKEITDDETKK